MRIRIRIRKKQSAIDDEECKLRDLTIKNLDRHLDCFKEFDGRKKEAIVANLTKE